VGITEGNGPRGKPRYKFEDNIKMDIYVVGWEVLIGFIGFRIWTSGGLL